MKKNFVLMVCVVLAAASVASAALGDMSTDGLTGLWRFHEKETGTNFATMEGTLGTEADIVNSAPYANGYWYNPVWVNIGVPGNGGLYSDGGAAQERSWDYLTVNPGFVANGGGGGSWVNEYTIAIDYRQDGSGNWNSLFQTNEFGNTSDGDLFTNPSGQIGIGDVGYSTLTYDTNTWHRIVLSVDNGNFFRVYVDGVLFLDGAGQAIDGRFSLYTDKFHLFADDSWEDKWGFVSTVATWNRALATAEVADMGGWIDGAANPTGLILIPEPATMVLLGLGGLVAIRRKK